MRKLTTLLLILLPLCLAFSQEPIDRSNYQLLWEITGPDTAEPSYLFGSMHVRDTAVFRFPDSLEYCLSAAEVFANEVEFDSAMYLVLRYQLLQEKPDYKIKPAQFDELEPKDSIWLQFEDKVVDKKGKRKERVSAFMDLLKNGFQKGKSMPTMLDSYLMDYAKSLGKPIYGLENIWEQLGDMISEEEEGEEAAGNNLGNNLRQVADFGRLRQAYLKGDLKEIWEIAQRSDSVEMWDIERRNYHMASSMMPIMKTKSLFSVVGAAHLPGPHGLVRILERRGYTLRPVSSTFSDKALFVPEPGPPVTKTLYGPQYSYTAQFPNFEVPFLNSDGGNGYVHLDIGKGLYYQIGIYDFLAIDEAEMEENFFSDEYAEIASRDTLSTDPWLIIDYRSDSLNMEDDLANFRAKVYRQKGRAFLVYVSAYAHEQLDHPHVEHFFENVDIKDLPKGRKILIDSTAGFYLEVPAAVRKFTLYENESMDQGDEWSYPIRLYIGPDAEGDSRYFARWSALPPGQYIYDTDTYLSGELDFLAAYFETEIDSSQLNPLSNNHGYYGSMELEDSLKLDYKVWISNNRSFILATERPMGSPLDKDFFTSFQFFPNGFQKYQNVTMLDGKLSVSMPGPLAHYDMDYYNDSKGHIVGGHYYYVTDSLASMPYTIGIREYSSYYAAKDTTKLLEALVDYFADSYFDSTLIKERIILKGGIPAMKVQFISNESHLQEKSIIYALGPYGISHTVHGTHEQLEELDDFFAKAVSIPDSLSLRSVYASKLDVIKRVLSKNDKEEREKIDNISRQYQTNLEEAEEICKMAKNVDQLDPIYLQLLEQRPAEELFEFYRDYFPRIVKESVQRDPILRHLSNDKSEAALKLFFDLLAQVPENTEGYTDIFYPIIDSIALFTANSDQFSNMFAKGVYPDIYFKLNTLAIIEGALPYSEEQFEMVEAKAAQMLSQWKPYKEGRDSKVQDDYPTYVINYYKSTGLAAEPMKEQLLAFAKKWPNHRFGLDAILALLESQQKVPKKLLIALANDQEQYLPLLQGLSQNDQLKRLPKRYYDEPNIARLMLERDFQSYDVTFKKIKSDGRFVGKFRDKDIAYYRFRFNDGVDKNRVAVVAAFPITSKEKAIINLNLVNYTYYNVSSADWTNTAENLLKEMEEW